jgi:hypothetical protein
MDWLTRKVFDVLNDGITPLFFIAALLHNFY